jgi:hypothetical protein
MDIKEIHIYDIDGTLVDSSHRYRTIVKNKKLAIDFPFWVANQHLAADDSLLPLARKYQAQKLDKGIFTVLATARAMSVQEWRHVKNILTMPDFMICRQHGDMQSGTTLKIDGLNLMLGAYPFLRNVPMFFYEDNKTYLNSVVDYFKPLCSGVYVPSKQGY